MSIVAVNQVQAYAKGMVLFAPGDQGAAVYFILDGTVIASKGGEQVVLGPGGILGDVSFFGERPHFYAAVCATDVKAMTITKDNSAQVFASQPRIACTLLRELGQKTVDTDKMLFFQGIEVQKQESSSVRSGLFPQGHPVFSQRVPAEHNEYLFPTEVECPICKQQFSGMRTRTSRLQLDEQKADFRSIYRHFEPNFYYIWVCPKCLFAYPERQYGRLSQAMIRRGQNALKENPPSESFEFDGQRSLHQVITSYYLTTATFEKVGAPSDLWANLWLRLVWIYEDLGANDLALEAAEKSRQYFEEAMSTSARSAAGDQQLYLILGELDLRLGRSGEAFKNIHAAATMIGGDPRYKRMAADKIQDLRDR